MASPSLGRRLVSMLYESVVLFGLLWTIGLIWGVAVGQHDGMLHRSGLQIAVFLGLGAYCVGFWSTNGQTVAMRAWHLRLVGPDGRPPRPLRAAWRYVLAWLWLLPPLALSRTLGWPLVASAGAALAWVALWAAASRLRADRQFWHDAWAGTRLVRVPD